jgi:Asp-tRNA(Asn)/Glu-tRNA(Gln) amidotransferase A subunit family amidase
MSLFAPQSLRAYLQDRDQNNIDPDVLLQRSWERVNEIEQDVQAFTCLSNKSQTAGNGPLAGIAIGVKDIFDTHDLPTEYGSEIYQSNQPKVDAAIVAMLRSKGASIIGKTTTTEFAFFKPTKTKNPNNLDYSPGGSSAGSAASVAAGMVTAAIGTQTGGSMVRPAAFCGVAGFKPSYRILPTTGMKYFAQSLDTAGTFAKSVADVATFTSLFTDRDLEIEEINPSDIRIGIYQNDILSEASDDMIAAFDKAALATEKAGFKIVKLDEPSELKKAHELHSTIQCFEAAQALGPEFALYPDLLSDKIKEAINEGIAITPDEYDNARRSAKNARRKTHTLYDDVDVILTPSAPGAAPKGFATTGVATFNKLWTLMGNPCINIPAFRDGNHMPLGIQAVGKFGRDKLTLSIAHALQNTFERSA